MNMLAPCPTMTAMTHGNAAQPVGSFRMIQHAENPDVIPKMVATVARQ
jgi:hypothetical protein